MSNDNKPTARDIIESLVACHEEPSCPAVALAQEWLAALPAEKPAAAAERRAVGLTVWKGDVAELAVQHGIYREPDEEDVQAFAKAVLAAATVNATPPAQAAEPAQVDEPSPEFDVRKILLEVAPGPDGMGVEVYAKNVDEVVAVLGEMVEENERLRAALTQRPAAPLATDAGVACDHDWQVHAGSGIEVCTKCKRGRVGAGGPTSGTAQASDDTSEYFRGWNAGYRNGLRAAGPDPMDEDAVRAADTINGATVDTTSANYRRLNVAAHPAAERPAQGEAGDLLPRAIKALEDLSFECFAVFGTCAPSINTYNRTFSVLTELRSATAAQCAASGTSKQKTDGALSGGASLLPRAPEGKA